MPGQMIYTDKLTWKGNSNSASRFRDTSFSEVRCYNYKLARETSRFGDTKF